MAKKNEPKEGASSEASAPRSTAPVVETPTRLEPKAPRFQKAVTIITTWVVAVLVVVAIVVFVRHRREARPESTAFVTRIVPQLNSSSPYDFTGRDSVAVINLDFSTRKPFYQQVKYDSLQAGDWLQFIAEGQGGFDAFYRARGGDAVTPLGYVKKPREMTDNAGKKLYLMRDEQIACLMGAIGVIRVDDERVPHVEGTPPFYIGTDTVVQVPSMPTVGHIFLALNEKWVQAAWTDNWGSYKVRVIVWRVQQAPTT